jgi:hypothetical protein
MRPFRNRQVNELRLICVWFGSSSTRFRHPPKRSQALLKIYTNPSKSCLESHPNSSRIIHEAFPNLSRSRDESVLKQSQTCLEPVSNLSRSRVEHKSKRSRRNCKFSRRVMKRKRVFYYFCRTKVLFSRRISIIF